MTELLEAALAYAVRGWRVFPVHGIVDGRCSCQRDCSSPGKHPLVRRGLHEGTTDRRVIEEWLARWRFANIAISTGELVVIDIDLPSALVSLDALIGKLPRTLTTLTGGGGVHLYFRGRNLRNHAGYLPGLGELSGIDLRATGGYVVAPPSLHISGNRYEWLDESVPTAAAPAWLRQRERPEPVEVPLGTASTESSPYGLAALRSEIEILLRTPVGRRNNQLNRSAFAIAQLVAGGELMGSPTRSALMAAALDVGLYDIESCRTIASAFEAGLRQPRSCGLD